MNPLKYPLTTLFDLMGRTDEKVHERPWGDSPELTFTLASIGRDVELSVHEQNKRLARR